MGKKFEVNINTEDEVRDIINYIHGILDYEDVEVTYLDED